MTVQEILKKSLLLDELSPDVLMDIERVEQKVRNFCNIDTVPEELGFTVADMVMAVRKAKDGDNLTISSVSMGDTSYSFKADGVIDAVMNDFVSDLMDYRKLRW